MMFGGNLLEMPYVIVGGKRRYLACKVPRDDFGGLPKFKGSGLVIPRSQWKPVSRRSMFPAKDWVLDQGEIGSCVGNGSAVALRKTRLLAGQGDVPLSPGCLYAQINGGVDQGAIISDALTALQQAGTCTYATVGESPYLLSLLPAGWQQEAQRFRIAQAYHCASFDEICSAIQLGFVAVFGIMVGQNFQNFDSSGVAGHSPGPGNHCVHADGLFQAADGRWVLDMQNSWGPSWGPFGNGRCGIDEQHFTHGDQSDAFVPISAIDDPLDPHEVPKAA